MYACTNAWCCCVRGGEEGVNALNVHGRSTTSQYLTHRILLTHICTHNKHPDKPDPLHHPERLNCRLIRQPSLSSLSTPNNKSQSNLAQSLHLK